MRNPLKILFTLCILSGLLYSGTAHALSVDSVRFGVYPDRTRIVLDISEKTEFRAFALADPYRVVIDLPDFAWNAGQVGRIARITGLRHGPLEPGVSRIVFETPQAVGIQAAFIMPRGDGKPDRLVIDFGPSPAGAAQRTYGTLMTPPTLANATSPQSLTLPPDEGTPAPPAQAGKPLIVIDAGHGGQDPGATEHGIMEKHITLALAKELRRQLLESGQYNVKLTRETDKFIILKERVNIARKAGADLFISIHADSIGKPDVHGASMYTLSNKASDEQSAKLAARENKVDLIAGIDLSVEDKEVADILVDLARRETMNQSRFFAGKLVSSFRNNGLSLLDGPQRSAGFAVLKAPDIPSVLVESGYVSNSKEAALLNTEAHRRKLAKALKKGIDAYFEQVRKNQRL